MPTIARAGIDRSFLEFNALDVTRYYLFDTKIKLVLKKKEMHFIPATTGGMALKKNNNQKVVAEMKTRQTQTSYENSRREVAPFKSLNKRTKRVYKHIHDCIHSNRQHVVVDNIKYKVQVSNTGQRFIKVGWDTFSQQNPNQKTKLAIISKTENVTRVLRGGGKWGHIVGAGESLEIVDPKLES